MPKYTLQQFLAIKADWTRRVYHTPEEWADLLGIWRDASGDFQQPVDSAGNLKIAGSVSTPLEGFGGTLYGPPERFDIVAATAPPGQLASSTLANPITGYYPVVVLEVCTSALGSSGSPAFYFGGSVGTGALDAGPSTGRVSGASLTQWQVNPFSYYGLVLMTDEDGDAITVAGGSFAGADTLHLQGYRFYET